jgi:S1-C subfamily serine protease
MQSALRFLGICVAVMVSGSAVRAAGDEAGFIGIQIKNHNGEVLIVSTLPDSPAEKAELKPDDVLVKANGNKVESIQMFVTTVRETKPGETLVLTVRRGDKEMEIKVKVGKKQD